MVAVSYRTAQLERECTDEREMKRRYALPIAKGLRRRIAELRAAADVDDLKAGPGKWEALVGDRVGQWSGRLTGNWRLIVEPDDDGAAVQVVEIVDYH